MKLRIAILISSRKWIGEAAHCIDLYKCLEENGHNVVIICRKGYAVEEYARKYDLKYYSLSLKGNFNGIDDFRDFLKLRKIIKELNIEILHCHRGKDHWLSAVTSLTLKNRPFIIRTRHVVTPVKNHIFNKWLYKSATDFIIGVSHQALLSFGNIYPIIESKSKVIYSSVDTEQFAPKNRSEIIRRELGAASPDTQLIGIVARLQRVKGQRYFIQAAKEVLAEFTNAKFLIIGKGNTDKLRRMAEELGIEDAISFIGFRNDINQVIASLDIGVIASIGSEGSSRIAFEYMASGVPVVATKVGGIPEIIEDGKTGLLIEPRDYKQISRAVLHILKDPSFRERLIINSLSAIKTKYTRRRWLSEIEDVYTSLK